MSEIQRYYIPNGISEAQPSDEGFFVTYADHLEALRQAEGREWHAGIKRGYEQGQRDALAAAVQRVKAAIAAGLETSSDKALYFFELDEDDPTTGHDVTFNIEAIIAAIKGDSE